MPKTILSTGEFAELCKTTKATLFHYEKLGLLNPKYVSGNGYRRYGIEQFFDFDTITVFKETGSTLGEIMQIRDNPDDDGLLELLEEKRRILRKEKERLGHREAMLGNMLADLHEARNLVLDEFMIQELADEYLEITPVGGNNHENMADSVIRYAAYMSSRGDEPAPRSSFGVILDESILKGAPYHELFYFRRTNRHIAKAMRKPAGKYLVVGHKGDFVSHLDCLKDAAQWCSANNARVSGQIYSYDLASLLRPQVIENYLVKYEIMIDAPHL